MFMYPSKASLDEKILFVKIFDQLDPEIRKMLVRCWFGNEGSTFPLAHNLLAIEIKHLFLKMTMKT